MKVIKKICGLILVCGFILGTAFSVSAADRESPKVEIQFFNEAGDEVKVTKEMVDSLIKQLDVDIETSSVYKNTLRNDCTHIPCNQVATTLYSHVKISASECWVYTKRATVCKCCGAVLRSLSNWKFAYSHATHF